MLYLEIKDETCEHITMEGKVGELCSKVLKQLRYVSPSTAIGLFNVSFLC